MKNSTNMTSTNSGSRGEGDAALIAAAEFDAVVTALPDHTLTVPSGVLIPGDAVNRSNDGTQRVATAYPWSDEDRAFLEQTFPSLVWSKRLPDGWYGVEDELV